MATPVKIIPTLHGEAARAFIERAEEHERNPHPTPIYTEPKRAVSRSRANRHLN